MHVETNPKHYPNSAFASKNELIENFKLIYRIYLEQHSHIN